MEAAPDAFDSVWPTLTPEQQVRLLDRLVERVAYDGGKQTVAITFYTTGNQPLADDCANNTDDCAHHTKEQSA